uniref:Uncharacterized protein n=1 Tax=viral metagenome TaxID=1070528 RepID=A0A6C0EK63_9ZZZZ
MEKEKCDISILDAIYPRESYPRGYLYIYHYEDSDSNEFVTGHVSDSDELNELIRKLSDMLDTDYENRHEGEIEIMASSSHGRLNFKAWNRTL